MVKRYTQAFAENFLGNSPTWYKQVIIGFLILNPLVLSFFGPVPAGWLLIGEFIFTLAMALKCYPLQAGGLLAIEAVAIGLTSPEMVLHKLESNLEVLLLLIFMVAGIYFLKNLLLFVFSRILLGVKSKILLSLLFCFVSAFLSAFLDALTVTAVVIAVAVGFYGIYHKVASGKHFDHEHDHSSDHEVHILHREDLDNFRAFLRSLLMHAAVGTALGGVCTLVGEPQNLLIASKAGWNFGEFLIRMAPVTLPVFLIGMGTCALLEITGWFGYGTRLPKPVRLIMQDYTRTQDEQRTEKDVAVLIIQAIAAVWLIIGLAFHLATVGLIGLSVIIIATALCGITDEQQVGHAFEEALPFTALLTVFFAVVAVIYEQQLFAPIIHYVLSLESNQQGTAFYLANGILSAVSDNVFVATVYIDEVKEALMSGEITRDKFDLLAVAINTGTNIPSVATPNGQAAFLFLLTSSIAPLVRLSYGRMVWMALPYTLIMTTAGLLAVQHLLTPATHYFYQNNWIQHHQTSELVPAAEERGDEGHSQEKAIAPESH